MKDNCYVHIYYILLYMILDQNRDKHVLPTGFIGFNMFQYIVYWGYPKRGLLSLPKNLFSKNETYYNFHLSMSFASPRVFYHIGSPPSWKRFDLKITAKKNAAARIHACTSSLTNGSGTFGVVGWLSLVKLGTWVNGRSITLNN